MAHSAFPILEEIHIAAPCPADWQMMKGDSRVRHCCECNLNVYNLSAMTRREAEQLILRHEGRMCVRFYRRADGTVITQNCPRGLSMLIGRASRIGAALLTAAMSIGSAFSQATQKANPQAQTQEDPTTAGMDITVVDPTGALIPNAKAELCQCKDHSKINASTGAAGVAHFTGLKPGTYSIQIQAPVFKTSRQDVKIKAKKEQRLQVKLRVAPTSTTVEVTAAPVEVQGTTVGIVVTTHESVPSPEAVNGGRPVPLR